MPVELGVNPLRVHCLLKALDASRIGCKSIEITLPVKGFRCQLNSTGRIGCKSIEIDAGRIGCKSIEIDAGRIGCKSIEITLPVKGLRCQLNSTSGIQPVELGVNPLR